MLIEIDKMIEALNAGDLRFHDQLQHNLMYSALSLHREGQYVASGAISASLFENLFLRALIRAKTRGTVPSPAEVARQVSGLLAAEDRINTAESLSFTSILNELVRHGVVEKAEVPGYLRTHKALCLPFARGLVLRLIINEVGPEGVPPVAVFGVDDGKSLRNASFRFIAEIHRIVRSGALLRNDPEDIRSIPR